MQGCYHWLSGCFIVVSMEFLCQIRLSFAIISALYANLGHYSLFQMFSLFLVCNNRPNWNEYWSIFEITEYKLEFRLNAMKNSLYGIIDLLCLFIGLLAFLCIPLHRTPCYFRCLGLLFDNLSNNKRKNKYPLLREYHLWICVSIVNILRSIIDIFIISPLFLIAFITHPISTLQSFNKFAIDWDPKPAQNQQNNNNDTFNDQWQKLIRYNFELRFQFFLLAVFGLFGMLNASNYP